MDDSEDSALASAVAGAIAWWRDAGVDLCFDDTPARWISPAQPTAREAERLRAEMREAAPPIASDSDSGGASALTYEAKSRQLATGSRSDAVDLSAFPTDPASFAQWWLSEPSVDGGRSGDRIAPRGPIGAQLMVLVAEPEADDDDRLLSGLQGRLLTAILGAAGLPEDKVYIASVLPRHVPMPDWDDLALRGIGEVLGRHIALMAPQRLVAFGGSILSLLDNSLPHIAAEPRFFAHGERQIPLFPARSLDAIIARPAWKAELWKGLLDWLPIVLD